MIRGVPKSRHSTLASIPDSSRVRIKKEGGRQALQHHDTGAEPYLPLCSALFARSASLQAHRRYSAYSSRLPSTTCL